MAWNSIGIWGAICCITLVAACNPAPPIEQVSDPFAPLPATPPVSTGPIAAPGVISDEVITPADPTSPITPAAPLDPTSAEGVDGGASDTVLADGPGELVDRLPNTCRLENYAQYQDTDGLIAVGLVTDRPARLVAPGDIVSQVYDPQRVNFYTNSAGRVVRISCG